jgi:hypothetical protein
MRTSRITGVAATATAAIALLASCTSRPSTSGPHADPRTPASHTPAPSRSTGFDTQLQLFPLSPADLSTAIRVATGFAAAYATYSYAESLQTYLARLRPMTTPGLYATLARAAATPGLLSRRTRDHQAATAQAVPERIRTIGPASLILIVGLRENITSSTGHRQHTERLAVTATKTTGTWLISDVEPASAGDAGNESTFHASAP